MSTNLPVPIGGTGMAQAERPAEIEAGFGAASDSARLYARAEKAEATRRAYAADWRNFQDWCRTCRCAALPASPEAVAAYLAHLADSGRKASTIDRRVAAITAAHHRLGLTPPTADEAVKAVQRGIRRSIGTAVTRKAPATATVMRAVLRQIPDDLRGLRDRALLSIGFAAALRRSEIVALDVTDLERVPEGLFVRIRRSKTDQTGEGHSVAVPRGSKLKPVEAVEAWLAAAEIAVGPLFRPIGKGGRVIEARLSDRSVADIVKARVAGAGFDPAAFSGHSLRAGLVTSALEAGADALKVMDITRHTSVQTLKGYDRRAKAFKDHAGKGFL